MAEQPTTVPITPEEFVQGILILLQDHSRHDADYSAFFSWLNARAREGKIATVNSWFSHHRQDVERLLRLAREKGGA